MKRKVRQFIAILAAFCIAFTGMPLMAGSLDAHAASKFTIKSAKAVSSSAVKLTWKKYKKSNTYEVYRDGELVDRITKTSYTDEGLDASTEYAYKVKALKKYTKKQKQYFNKKTGEWQTKKPAKKYRGKSKTVKLTKYKTLGTSKAKYVETKAPDRIIFDDTDLDQDVSGETVKVYALSDIKVGVDYSEAEGASGLESIGYTEKYQYNNNGLLKKSISDADPNKWGSHTGTMTYVYTGNKVTRLWVDDGQSAPKQYVFNYEGGKAKSVTWSYPTIEDDEPFTEYFTVNSMGRITSKYYTITSMGKTEKFRSDYQYTNEGYLKKAASFYDSNTPGAEIIYSYDAKGNAEKYVYTGLLSPMSGQVKTVTNTASNSYANGRLSRTLIRDYYGAKTEIALNYKEISVPVEYQKAFEAQQHDMIFRYVYEHITNTVGNYEIPLGLAG